MRLRNAHSGAFILPSGQKVAPGEEFDAPDAMRSHALVHAGVFVEIAKIEEPTVADPALRPAPKGSRGGK